MSTKLSKHTQTQTREAYRLKRPENREELWAWVKVVLGMKLPRRAVCPHHQTPLDYLEYVFFEQTDPPDVVVWACRGGGKTMIGAIATLLDMLFKPGTQIRILGGSAEQSAKMYAYLRNLVEDHFDDQLRGRISRKGFSFDNGSRVEILAQSHTAVRGTRVQKMRCDEVELFDPEVWQAAQLTTRSLSAKSEEMTNDDCRTTNQIQNPKPKIEKPATSSPLHLVTPSGSRGAVEVYSTMHKVNGLMSDLLGAQRGAGDCGAALPGGEHRTEAQCHDTRPDSGHEARRVFAWCVWDVIEKCHPNRKCETCVLWDECRGRARHADGFIAVADVIAMKRRTSARTWESEMLCFRPYTEDQVFAAFSRSMHVRALDLPAPGAAVESPPARGLRLESLIAGIDFGWRTFACVWLAMLRNGAGERVVWAVDEYVAEKRPLESHVAAVKSRHIGEKPLRPSVVYCDVAGRQHDAHSGESSEHQLRAAGFRVQSRAMAIEDGIGALNVLLEPRNAGEEEPVPRFYVHPRCAALIAALESYRRDAKGKPVKDGAHDHIVDALRYVVVGHEQKPSRTTARLY